MDKLRHQPAMVERERESFQWQRLVTHTRSLSLSPVSIRLISDNLVVRLAVQGSLPVRADDLAP